jgi:hypothetical protein
MESPARRAAEIWLGAFIGLAGILVFLYPDGYQQDGGNHFLFARWAWIHPELLVGVWSRPAFTLLYSLPAQFGYPAAKLFTVGLCAVTAWQTWRLAEHLGLARSALAVPLLVLQPSFLLLCSDTLTEPLFALIFVTALRLHHAGRVVSGMLVASLMILARPEGFVLGVVWGAWILLVPRDPRPAWRRIPSVLLLASGAAAWWLAAWLISGDPLYIKHHWPPDWTATGAPYGSGPIWGYAARLPEIAGRLLQVPLVVGLAVLLARRRGGTLTSPVLAVLMIHSALWSFGGLGSAGYARYMVTVAPAMALIALTGWNVIADRCARLPRGVRIASAGAVLAASAVFAAMYVDGWIYSRDARLIAETHADFMKSPRPVKRLVWSQAYMAILFDADPWSAPTWGDRAKNLEIIAGLPSGTLVFWDDETGPSWFHLTRADFQGAGFELIISRGQALEGRFLKGRVLGFGGTRRQEMHLLYRP